MIRQLKTIALFLLSMSTMNSYAGNFFIAPEIGFAEVDVTEEYSADGRKDGSSGFSLGLSAGYQFDMNLLLELNYSETAFSTFDVFDTNDHYEVKDYRALIGYRFNISDKFKITPKVGVSSWRLDVDDEEWFDSEENDKDYDGSDVVFQLNFDFPISETFHMYALYTYYDIEFGDYEAVRAGFKFNF